MKNATVRFGVVVFPGSNCDHDAYQVCKKILGQDAVFLWHKEHSLQAADVVAGQRIQVERLGREVLRHHPVLKGLPEAVRGMLSLY